MEIQVRRAHGDAVAQHAAALGIRFRRGQLELGAVHFHRDGGSGAAHAETVGGRAHGGTCLQKLAAVPVRQFHSGYCHLAFPLSAV
jgi:hypothetical protein